MIKAIVFDLYDTLIYMPKGPMKDLIRELGLDFETVKRVSMTNEYDSLAELCADLAPGYQIDTDKYEQQIQEEIKQARFFPETEEVLANINLPKGLISNLSTPYKQPFFNLGIDRMVDHYVFSCDVGYRKPQGEIFELMLAKLGLPANEVLMVGDSLRSDYEGARAVGMQALHIDRPKVDLRAIFGKL
jgi:HAD superfamily hydrolase (TIGR01549 family)